MESCAVEEAGETKEEQHNDLTDAGQEDTLEFVIMKEETDEEALSVAASEDSETEDGSHSDESCKLFIQDGITSTFSTKESETPLVSANEASKDDKNESEEEENLLDDAKETERNNIPLSQEDMHRKLHPYQCHLCESAFGLQKHLKIHISVSHKDIQEKSFQCDECYKKYSSKTVLQRHVLTVHMNVKPFKCQDCDMSFGRKEVLKSHTSSVHRKLRPFICGECNGAFGKKGDLTTHISIVHRKIKLFECLICNRSFGYRSDLKRHMTQVHREICLTSLG